MHYYVGDNPAEVLEVATPEAIDLAAYTGASASLEPPAGGAPVALTATIGPSPEDAELVVLVTLAGPLAGAGVHRLVITLAGPGEVRTLAPLRLPVELPDGGGWYTLDAARAAWPGAPADDARLFDLLTVARDQVIAYGPALEAGAPVPARFREAQLMQARNVWNAGMTDPNTSMTGADGFAVPVYPLDWAVRQMIRPRGGVPRVG